MDMQGSRAHGLMYHGVCNGPDSTSSSRRSYDVSLQTLAQHMQAIGAGANTAPSTSIGPPAAMPQWAITFDDGAESALEAADLLESHGWRAYFFVVSSWIGNRGFLNAQQISDLRDRGHVVGSHSVSHPDPMSGLPYERIVREWRKSVEKLGEVLGEPVKTAAVPGGGYSSKVAAAAAEAGIEVLFTSEPVLMTRRVQDCTVIGRYAIRSSTDAETAAALAAGRRGPCATQWLSWNSKKLTKKLLGDSYYTIRTRILATDDRSRQ